MVESNKFARKTVRTGWYSEKKNEPVDDPVHIREVAQLKTEITQALKAGLVGRKLLLLEQEKNIFHGDWEFLWKQSIG